MAVKIQKVQLSPDELGEMGRVERLVASASKLNLENYCACAMARDEDGYYVSAYDECAVEWCALGALAHYGALNHFVRGNRYSISDINDSSPQLLPDLWSELLELAAAIDRGDVP